MEATHSWGGISYAQTWEAPWERTNIWINILFWHNLQLIGKNYFLNFAKNSCKMCSKQLWTSDWWIIGKLFDKLPTKSCKPISQSRIRRGNGRQYIGSPGNVNIMQGPIFWPDRSGNATSLETACRAERSGKKKSDDEFVLN